MTQTMHLNNWQSLFLGRQEEIDRLLRIWELAKNGEPQIAVLTGHPGLGKTRIVQEFYHCLSTSEDGKGSEGYWPDHLSRNRDALRLAPPPSDCVDSNDMPYLWWGFKLVDLGSNSAGSSSLHEATDLFLTPHLAAMRRAVLKEEIQKEKTLVKKAGVKDAVTIGTETGIGLIPIVGPILTTVTSSYRAARNRLVQLKSLENQEAELNRSVTVGSASTREQKSLEDSIVASIKDYIEAGKRDKKKSSTAIVVVVDDAQFSSNDKAASSLLTRLMKEASDARWPLMILMTYWPDKWNSELQKEVGLANTASQLAKSVNQTGVTEIPIRPLNDLHPLLESALPGLPKGQCSEILKKSSGNPRYLERLIQLLLNSPALFVQRNVGGKLTEDALEIIVDETFDIHEVTRHILESASVEAQQALALASLFGLRFVCNNVVSFGERLGIDEVNEGLHYCEQPLVIVNGVSSGIAEFQQNVFYSVALQSAPRLISSVTEIENTLISFYRHILDNWTEFESGRLDSQEQMLTNLTSRYDVQQSNKEQLQLRGRAILRMIGILSNKRDLISRSEATMQWYAGLDNGYWQLSDFNASELNIIVWMHSMDGNDKKALQLATENLAYWRKVAGSCSNKKMQLNLVVALNAIGHLSNGLHNTENAEVFADEALEIMSEWKNLEENSESNLEYCDALYLKSCVVSANNGPTAATSYVEKMLSQCRKGYARSMNANWANNLNNALYIVSENRNSYSVENSIELYEEMLSVAKFLNDEQHSSESMTQLANAYVFRGRYISKIQGARLALNDFIESERLALVAYEKSGSQSGYDRYADALFNLSNVYKELGELSTAVELQSKAVEIKNTIWKEQKTPDAKKKLVISMATLLDVQSLHNGPSFALPLAKELCTLSNSLHSEIGTIESAQYHANCLRRLAQILGKTGDTSSALSVQEESTKFMRENHNRVGTLTSMEHLANTLLNSAALVSELAGFKEALPYVAEAYAVSKERCRMDDSASAHQQLSLCLQNYARTNERLERNEYSDELYKELLELRRKLVRESTTLETQLDLVDTLLDIGISVAQSKSAKVGIDYLKEALELVELMPIEHKDQRFYSTRSRVVSNYAAVLTHMGDMSESNAMYKKIVESDRQYFKDTGSAFALRQLIKAILDYVSSEQYLHGIAHVVDSLLEECADLSMKLVNMEDSFSSHNLRFRSLFARVPILESTKGPLAANEALQLCVSYAEKLDSSYHRPESAKLLSDTVYQQARLMSICSGHREASSIYERSLSLTKENHKNMDTAISARDVLLMQCKVVENQTNYLELAIAQRQLTNLIRSARIVYDESELTEDLSIYVDIMRMSLKVAVDNYYIDWCAGYVNGFEQQLRKYHHLRNDTDSKQTISFSLAELADVVLEVSGPKEALEKAIEAEQLLTDIYEKSTVPNEIKWCAAISSVVAELERYFSIDKAIEKATNSISLYDNAIQRCNSFSMIREKGHVLASRSKMIREAQGPLSAFEESQRCIVYARSLFEKDGSIISQRDLINALRDHAYNSAHPDKTTEFTACADECRDLIQLMLDKGGSNLKFYALLAERDLLICEHSIEIGWDVAFGEYNLDKQMADSLLPSFEKLVLNVEAFFGQGHTLKKASYTAPLIARLSLLYMSACREEEAMDSLNSYWSTSEFIENHTGSHHMTTIQNSSMPDISSVLRMADLHEEACNSYEIAIRGLRLRECYSPYSTARSLSSAYWFYGKLLTKLGKIDQAEKAMTDGLEQAIKFADCGGGDSQARLALYTQRTGPQIQDLALSDN